MLDSKKVARAEQQLLRESQTSEPGPLHKGEGAEGFLRRGETPIEVKKDLGSFLNEVDKLTHKLFTQELPTRDVVRKKEGQKLSFTHDGLRFTLVISNNVQGIQSTLEVVDKSKKPAFSAEVYQTLPGVIESMLSSHIEKLR